MQNFAMQKRGFAGLLFYNIPPLPIKLAGLNFKTELSFWWPWELWGSGSL